MMKTCAKLLALLLTLALLCSCFAVAETADENVSLYEDSSIYLNLVEQTEGRASMLLAQHGNGEMEGAIFWSDDDAYYYKWTFSTYAVNNEVIEYTNCLCEKVIPLGEGNAVAMQVYENGTGRVISQEDGFIWIDDQEDVGSGMLFMLDGDIQAVSNLVDIANDRVTMKLGGAMSSTAPKMDATITWADSAEEMTMWTMSFEPASIMLEAGVPMRYTDCVCRRFVTDEDGNMTYETLYENGAGSITMEYLDDTFDIGFVWQPDGDELAEPCVFVHQMIEGPARLEADDLWASELADYSPMDILSIYLTTMDEGEAQERVLMLCEDLDECRVLAVDGVGTLDGQPEQYCLDSYACEVESNEDYYGVSYEPETFERKLLADDVIAVVPVDAADPYSSGYMVLESAEELYAWYDASFSMQEEHAPMCFMYVEDADAVVQLLVFVLSM